MNTRELPRGLRNNNPGNIRINSDHFQGEVKPSQDKEFKQFSSMSHGYRAMFKIIRNYIIRYNLNTIENIITRWAPSSENHTGHYIRIVSERSEIPDNKFIDPLNKDQMTSIVSAMSYVENGTEADMNEVNAGWGLL